MGGSAATRSLRHDGRTESPVVLSSCSDSHIVSLTGNKAKSGSHQPKQRERCECDYCVAQEWNRIALLYQAQVCYSGVMLTKR